MEDLHLNNSLRRGQVVPKNCESKRLEIDIIIYVIITFHLC